VSRSVVFHGLQTSTDAKTVLLTPKGHARLPRPPPRTGPPVLTCAPVHRARRTQPAASVTARYCHGPNAGRCGTTPNANYNVHGKAWPRNRGCRGSVMRQRLPAEAVCHAVADSFTPSDALPWAPRAQVSCVGTAAARPCCSGRCPQRPTPTACRLGACGHARPQHIRTEASTDTDLRPGASVPFDPKVRRA
jgi:hypothetical protein